MIIFLKIDMYFNEILSAKEQVHMWLIFVRFFVLLLEDFKYPI